MTPRWLAPVVVVVLIALGTIAGLVVAVSGHSFDPNTACAEHQGVRQVTNHGAVCIDGYYARGR